MMYDNIIAVLLRSVEESYLLVFVSFDINGLADSDRRC